MEKEKRKSSGRGSGLRFAEEKDNSEKDNAKDAKAKEANAKDAKAKETKAKDANNKLSKYTKGIGSKNPKDKDPAEKPDGKAGETNDDPGFSYDEFPPSPRRQQTLPRKPVRTRRVFYHDENDLADTLDENPIKSAADDLYSPWDEAVKSMRYATVISGLSMAIALVADVAVNGTEKLTVERVWLPVQFLRTVMNDKGETPPNILKFLEHIDVMTKDSGNPNPKEVYTLI